MNPACSASLLMNDTDVRFYLLHTYMKSMWSSRCFQHKWGHKYTNNIPRTARRVTWWAFDRFIWVKRSSYHIYIGYRNLKGPHGNLSKYKFGLAEYITVYVIQLQQLLQLLFENNHTIRYFFHVFNFNSKLICLPKIKSNSHLIKR